jgi:hypothetical protein
LPDHGSHLPHAHVEHRTSPGCRFSVDGFHVLDCELLACKI